MTSNKLVLLTEDDVITQKITMLLLEALDYKFELARNGREAVEAVQSGQKFSVILIVPT